MNLQLVVVFVFLTFVRVNGQQSITSTCGQRWPEKTLSRLPRMTNAFQAERWPWHAAIYHINSGQSDLDYKCGGSLISSNLVLTTAHCVSKFNNPMSPKKVLVFLGRLDLEVNESSSQSFEVIFHY